MDFLRARLLLLFCALALLLLLSWLPLPGALLPPSLHGVSALAGASPPPSPRPRPRAPRSAEDFSSLYACPPGSPLAGCGGLSNLELVEAVHKRFFESGQPGANASEAARCYARRSVAARFTVVWPPSVPPSEVDTGSSGARCVELGVPHTLVLRAAGEDGAPVCGGGDYLEAALLGPTVRARPRTVDVGDGSYEVTLHLPDDPLLVGPASLAVTQLFRKFAGMAYFHNYVDDAPDEAVLRATAVSLVRFGGCGSAAPPARPRAPPTRSCRHVDFMAWPFWEGHWVAQPLAGSAPCAAGACVGAPPAAVLTAPWVYRLPECFFHLFSPPEARACLNGSWLFSSGDSNFLDTAGNLINATLGLHSEPGWMDVPAAHPKGRSFDIRGSRPGWNASLVDPRTLVDFNEPPPEPEAWLPDATWPAARFHFRVSNIWNAAPAESGALEDQCCHGLMVVHNAGWRGRHQSLLLPNGAAGRGPDLVFVNTGLHDGMRFSLHPYALRDFASELQLSAVDWWQGTLRGWASGGDGACKPRMIWRSSVAPAARARLKRANPQHLEVFNRLTAVAVAAAGGGRGRQALRERGDAQARGRCARPFHTDSDEWSFLDMFDMTFPWHFTEEVSDGGHYGRHFGPGTDNVDRMQIQVLLNGICPAP
jgi:hypothetical protein